MNDNTPLQPDQNKLSVIEKIRSGEIKMKPKAYFILKIILLVIVLIATLLTSSFIVSFIIFSIKISGKPLLFGFGNRGISMFFLLFPWKLLVVEIILLFLLQWLLKRFQFGYRNPFIYLLGGVLIVSIIAGLLINFTSFHKILLRRTEERRLPLIGGFYEHVRRPSDQRNVFSGTIKQIQPTYLMIEVDKKEQGNEEDNKIRQVLIPPNMPIARLLKNDDKVFVAGDLREGRFFAYGIRKIEPQDEIE